MLSFEQAVYEAFLFTSTTKARYDFDYILVTDTNVVATDGKRLYVAAIEHPPVQGYLRISCIAGGVHKYPKPKSNIKGYIVSDKDIMMLGTRFDVLKEASFPPYERIIQDHYDPIVLDCPELFTQGIKTLYQYGKKAAMDHLYRTGKKITPRYKGILYKNGNLHLVLECSLDGEFFPVSHAQLAKIKHPDQEDQNEQNVIVTFNPGLYALKQPPVAIGIIGSESSVLFEFPGRKLYMCPIKNAEEQNVANLVCWEEFEPTEIIN